MVRVETPTIFAIRSHDGNAFAPEVSACSARTMRTHFSVGFVGAGASYIAHRMAGRLMTVAPTLSTAEFRE